MTNYARQWIVALVLVVAVSLSASWAMGTDAQTTSTSAPVASRPTSADTRAVTPPSGAEDRPVSSDRRDGPWTSIIRTGVALAVVVALIFVLRLVLRRSRGGGGGKGPISILARKSVSARQQLLLVRLGRRLVLVGSGPEGMAALSEISDADEVADLVRQAGGKVEADDAPREERS